MTGCCCAAADWKGEAVSFTTEIKQELCRAPAPAETAPAECLGMLLFAGQLSRSALRLQLENAAVRRRVQNILRMTAGVTAEEEENLLLVTDGEELDLAGFHITAFDIGSKKMQQFGFLLDLPEGEHLCFAGDEPVKPSTEKYAKGAKWLFSEAYCLHADRDIYKPYERSHVTSLDAGNLAQEMGVKNMVIYHTADYGSDRRDRMTQEAASVFSGNIYVPEDMEAIQL